MVLIAISICFFGVMNLPLGSSERHEDMDETWDNELQHISSYYGPGAIISWFIVGISMLYDANQAFKTGSDWFQITKYGMIAFVGIVAWGDSTWRATHGDFGPQYAAGLYMFDKSLELAVLLYTLAMFPMARQPTYQMYQASWGSEDEERNPQRCVH